MQDTLLNVKFYCMFDIGTGVNIVSLCSGVHKPIILFLSSPRCPLLRQFWATVFILVMQPKYRRKDSAGGRSDAILTSN